MLVSLFHHLFLCFDQSFASKNQRLVHVIEYIFDLDDLQTLASAFILDNVRIEAHMRIKTLIHEEESQEND